MSKQSEIQLRINQTKEFKKGLLQQSLRARHERGNLPQVCNDLTCKACSVAWQSAASVQRLNLQSAAVLSGNLL